MSGHGRQSLVLVQPLYPNTFSQVILTATHLQSIEYSIHRIFLTAFVYEWYSGPTFWMSWPSLPFSPNLIRLRAGAGHRDSNEEAVVMASERKHCEPRVYGPRSRQKMKDKTGARMPNSGNTKFRNTLDGAGLPTRREFLRTAAGVGLALAGSPIAAWADHHAHPTPNSISYLDRRMYIHNMELLGHFMPGRVRNGKMQLMSIGDRRYMFQQGDVIDVSDVRKPTFTTRV